MSNSPPRPSPPHLGLRAHGPSRRRRRRCPRGRLLRPGSSVQAFLGGHFPRTWKKLSSWVVRRTFIRAVRLFVALRCKAPGYVPLSKEAYRKERDRLIRIGRAAVHAAPSQEHTAAFVTECVTATVHSLLSFVKTASHASLYVGVQAS